MKKLQALNKRTAPKSVMPEKIIQFGEGNFLRAFVDWIVWKMNQKTDFNGSVAVSYTHLDVYKRQDIESRLAHLVVFASFRV